MLAELEQIKQQAEQWKEVALRNAPPPQPQYQQNYQPATERAFSSQAPSYPSAQLMMENPAEYDRQMQAYIGFTNQQAIQQASGAITPQLAETQKFMSRNDPAYADVWKRYGNEIELEMVRNQVPPQMQTKQAWDMIAGIVQGRHVMDMANEIATQRLQSSGFNTESASNTGNVAPPPSDPVAAFWQTDHQWVQKAKNSGLNLSDVREHIKKMGLTPQQWVEDITKSRSFSAEAA